MSQPEFVSTIENSTKNNVNKLIDSVDLDQVKQKAKALGHDLNTKFEHGKDKTVHTLELTTKKLDDVTHYMREKDANDMVIDLYHIIRRNPFKTLMIVGMAGLLLSRGGKR